MKRNLVVLPAAALLAGMVGTDALAAGHGGFAGGHVGGRFGAPLIGSAPMTSPIYNPSTPYTVTQSPEVPVSPASPGSVFHQRLEIVGAAVGGCTASIRRAITPSLAHGGKPRARRWSLRGAPLFIRATKHTRSTSTNLSNSSPCRRRPGRSVKAAK